MDTSIKFLPSGDCGILVEFGNEISEEINDKVRGYVEVLRQNNIPAIKELIPSYKSVLVIYDPIESTYGHLLGFLRELINQISNEASSSSLVSEIPVLYGGENGIDLEYVSESSNLTVEEVIKIHAMPEYRIYMLGFAPGFPYLGGMDERIATPRLSSPRTHIKGGSVGIAGCQTGIYPLDSPGGWQFIGHTPVKLFDAKKSDPILFKAGDYIKFVPVSKDEYLEIKEAVDLGRYQIKQYKRRRLEYG